MSSVIFHKNDIAALIDYHIAILDRFETSDERDFSLIYFNQNKKTSAELTEVFHRILRKTDALFKDGEHVYVMLTGTDWNGATKLLGGIQGFLNQPLVDNIVSYPVDGLNSEELLDKLAHLVHDNCGHEPNFSKAILS